MCLYPSLQERKITNTSRRYWYQRFTDSELAQIASEFTGRMVPPAGIARQRAKFEALTASGRKRV